MSTKTAEREAHGAAFAERVYEHPSKMGREVEAFANYAHAYESEARNSTLSRVSNKLLGVRTEDGSTEILTVTTEKAIDRALGVSLVDRALEAVKRAEQDERSDVETDVMSAFKKDKDGNRRTLSVRCDRSAKRAQHTHGDGRDRLTYTFTTESKEGSQWHQTHFAVKLNGEVEMTGPEGDKSKVGGHSEAAERLQADLDSFPPLEFPPKPLF